MEKRIELAGEWRFSFEKPDYNDTIMLPGTTAMAKKGKPNDKEETGYLTERYPYEGTAWFARKITLPEDSVLSSGKAAKRIVLYLERARMTKIRVNGAEAGTGNSLTTPHRFDITKYINGRDVELEIAVSNTGYPTIGGHMTSPDTQTNWLGIMGRMELQISGEVSVQDVHTTCDITEKTMTFDYTVLNTTDGVISCQLSVQPETMHLSGLIEPEGKNYEADPAKLRVSRAKLPVYSENITVQPGTQTFHVTYAFDKGTVLWSEHTPVVCDVQITLSADGMADDHYHTYAALRAFTADEHDFYINGVRTKLRGKHDGLLFPMTGAAPMDLESWLCVMGRAWQYGINHYRYHTCCPPEAAFLAADLLGIYMEPELPFWGTIAAPGEEGYKEEEQEYLIEEGIRMLREYGNHPSYCMMSLGNELWGSKQRVNEIIGLLKKEDDRPLYTQGSNNFQFIPEILSNEDFLVAARLAPPVNGENKRLVRGSFAMCDAPLGAVQTMAPGTAFDFDAAVLPELAQEGSADTDKNTTVGEKEIAIQYGTGVKMVKAAEQDNGVTATVPIVGHEIGQYSMFPDFDEIEKYTGVLDARNMKVFKRRLEEAGMADRGKEFFECAGKFAVECYREELEMMHRSRYMAGYQILDIQDYTGQGTSLVGILDSFMDSKGLVKPETWRGYCSDEVLLGCFDRYVYEEKETFSAKVRLSYFNPMQPLIGKKVEWKLAVAENSHPGKVLASGSLPIEREETGTWTVGELQVTLPSSHEIHGEQRLMFTLEIPDTRMHRDYLLWMYAAKPKETEEKELCITTVSKEAWTALEAGKRVLYFPSEVKENIPGFYCTDFWNYTMFRQISESMGREVAVGTLGLCIQKDHPALADFACETYSTPQWYSVVSESKCAVLDGHLPAAYKPIVQMIDNVERNHKLGILFEVAAGNGGKLLICTADYVGLQKIPEGRQLIASIKSYAASEEFAPEMTMEQADFEALFA